jgi:hypothetical protein
MWNSFVMVARVSTLIGVIMVGIPVSYASFSKIRDLLGTASKPGFLDRLNERIPSASFSNEVLEHYPISLAVLSVRGVAWSDLGEPRGSWLFCRTWEFIPNARRLGT